jgi:hypothetical protein
VDELEGSGSCIGNKWANIFSNINLTVGPQFRSYAGSFDVPEVGPITDYWLVLAVVKTGAEYNGVVSVELVPEDLIDYSGMDEMQTPGCERSPDWRTVDVGGTVAAFGEVQNVEGEAMIVETAQCNSPRGLTRRTTHVYPMRMQDFGETNVDLAHIAAQIAGITGTLAQAALCVDQEGLIGDLEDALAAAQAAFGDANYAHAQVSAEEFSRLAKEAVDGFDLCPLAANYRGNLMARGLTLAFTFHDRYEHPELEDFEIYLVPFDLDIPLLRATSPNAANAVTGLVGRAKGLHINLRWDTPENASSYRVYRRLNTESNFTEVGEVTGYVYVDDLPGGTTSAEYYVVAENEFGQSSPSEVIVVTATTRQRRTRRSR